ncbi:DUF4262 domain-containing protein [Marinobacter salarius]|uniref:DUF4262 domain-containing protein n=1 Tax=Marinobacter salarius TaxID=1420917 RepID=UPI000F858567|nr:DUF4262 domain-containing protein [Marinobacter salarius]AZR39534.1 hypothetical protein MTMN5_00051 [Marinobacter salarius]
MGTVAEDIEAHGWHCVFVFDPEGEHSDFAYSIGFEESYRHPEVMVFGLGKDVSHAILADIAKDIQSGAVFEPGKRVPDVIGGDLDVCFQSVRPEAYDEYLGTAANYYQGPFRALVMFWPDKFNVLPQEDGWQENDQVEATKIV